ncbi:MAG: hypothetical protein QMD12_01655 [Candidatus Aenigmarchaeota archaeon]|nr:hypothetical protein [Candidatus Aenigmarchaeota archaeon]
MIYEFLVLNLVGVTLGFFTVLWFYVSNRRFLAGEIKKFVNKITAGMLFLYFSIVASSVIEIHGIYGSLLEIPKYLFIIAGFSCFYWASMALNKISKVLGFRSEIMPKKLKKILK